MSWWIYAAVKTGGRESVGLRMVATHRAIAYLVFDSRESCLECSNKIFFFFFFPSRLGDILLNLSFSRGM